MSYWGDSKVPQATLEHFKAIPWVSTRIANPAFRPVHLSRTLTHSGKGHTLMAKTWNSPDTIQHILSIYRPPNNDGTAAPTPDPSLKSLSHPRPTSKAELCRFYTFGDGLNAHPNLLHGGVVASILDSTMGNAMGQERPDVAAGSFTVELNIKYKKPIPTPGTIVVRAWTRKIEGRKVWIEGVVENEQGEVHAIGEGFWLGPKKDKL